MVQVGRPGLNWPYGTEPIGLHPAHLGSVKRPAGVCVPWHGREDPPSVVSVPSRKCLGLVLLQQLGGEDALGGLGMDMCSLPLAVVSMCHEDLAPSRASWGLPRGCSACVGLPGAAVCLRVVEVGRLARQLPLQADT